MNPLSNEYLSFNIGFPNAFDRYLGRTGSFLMVHGGCRSVGCYAMTDYKMEEIYGLVEEAFKGGQDKIQLQAFPFRMTTQTLARHAEDPNAPFWQVLKMGSDAFFATGRPPSVAVCDQHYVFNPVGTDNEEVRREYERIWSQLGTRAIEELIDLPLMSDPASLATLDLLTRVVPPALFTDANFLSLVTC